MEKAQVPDPVIAVVADVLGSHDYNHARVNTLLVKPGAPGEHRRGTVLGAEKGINPITDDCVALSCRHSRVSPWKRCGIVRMLFFLCPLIVTGGGRSSDNSQRFRITSRTYDAHSNLLGA